MPTKTDSVVLKDYRRFEYRVGNGPLNSSSRTATSDRWDMTKTGNWDRKRPVKLKPSPYALSTTAVRLPRLSIAGDTPFGDWRRYSGTFTGGVPYDWRPADESSRLKNMALLDMLSNVKDQSWNAGVALAEAKGTAQLVGDVAELLVQTLRFLNKHEFKRAYENFRKKAKKSLSWEQVRKDYATSFSRSERLRKVPNSWTYYHFGIKPTIDDIDNIKNDWDRRNLSTTAPTPERFSGQVRGKARFPVRNEGFVTFDIFDRALMQFTDIQSVRVTCGIRLKAESLARLSQMGVTNVPEAVWNGIPFSWAVDYFTSFGDWLSALDSSVGWEYFDLCESYRRVITEKCSYFENASNPSVPFGVAKVERPYVLRTKILVRTVPPLLYPPVYRTRPMMSLKGPSAQRISMLASVLSGLLSGSVSDVVRY